MEKHTIETNEIQVKFTQKKKTVIRTSISNAIQCCAEMLEQEDINNDTDALICSINRFNEKIKMRNITGTNIFKQLACMVNRLSVEELTMMLAICIECIKYKENMDDELQYIKQIQQAFVEKICNLPSDEKNMIKDTGSTQNIVNTYEHFDHWKEHIDEKEKEQILDMSPYAGLIFFGMDFYTVWQNLTDDDAASKFRRDPCVFATRSPFVCSVGGFCKNSHHPLTRDWIDQNYEKIKGYLSAVFNTN